eukprot:PhM_4_TR18094/c6_g2_i1/m.49204
MYLKNEPIFWKKEFVVFMIFLKKREAKIHKEEKKKMTFFFYAPNDENDDTPSKIDNADAVPPLGRCTDSDGRGRGGLTRSIHFITHFRTSFSDLTGHATACASSSSSPASSRRRACKGTPCSF